MYLPTFVVLAWLSFATKSQACTIRCGDLKTCIAPGGLGAGCEGFLGCHETCPLDNDQPKTLGNSIDFLNQINVFLLY
jgi:hypothetical protein